MTVHRASITDKIMVHEKLKEVLETEDNGFCHYKPGWDDYRIARGINGGISHHTVAHVRKEMFGQLRGREGGRVKNSKKFAELNARITKLEDMLGVGA